MLDDLSQDTFTPRAYKADLGEAVAATRRQGVCLAEGLRDALAPGQLVYVPSRIVTPVDAACVKRKRRQGTATRRAGTQQAEPQVLSV